MCIRDRTGVVWHILNMCVTSVCVTYNVYHCDRCWCDMYHCDRCWWHALYIIETDVDMCQMSLLHVLLWHIPLWHVLVWHITYTILTNVVVIYALYHCHGCWCDTYHMVKTGVTYTIHHCDRCWCDICHISQVKVLVCHMSYITVTCAGVTYAI